jgi:hypothetical protein
MFDLSRLTKLTIISVIVFHGVQAVGFVYFIFHVSGLIIGFEYRSSSIITIGAGTLGDIFEPAECGTR